MRQLKKLYTLALAKSPQGSVHIWKDKQFLCRNLEQNYSHYWLLSANLSKKINRYHLHIILNTVQTCYLVTIYLTQELGEMWGWRYKKCIQSLTKDPAAFLRITRIMWVTFFRWVGQWDNKMYSNPSPFRASPFTDFNKKLIGKMTHGSTFLCEFSGKFNQCIKIYY